MQSVKLIIQTHTQTNRQTHTYGTEKHTIDPWTYRKIHRWIEIHRQKMYVHKQTHIHTQQHSVRHSDEFTERKTDRHIIIQADTHTEIQTDMHVHVPTQTHKKGQREREREMQIVKRILFWGWTILTARTAFSCPCSTLQSRAVASILPDAIRVL